MSDDVKIKFRNHYVCERCSEEWTDDWDSTCDDRCPSCNQSTSPHHSDDLDEEGHVHDSEPVDR